MRHFARGKNVTRRSLDPVQNPAVCRDNYHVPGDQLSAVQQRVFHRLLDAAAAGNLHPYHRDAADVVVLQDLCELLGIVNGVQLGAAYQRDAALDEILMEIGIW